MEKESGTSGSSYKYLRWVVTGVILVVAVTKTTTEICF